MTIRVETNNYSAEFGNVAGGVVSPITKSGSNEFHGSAFEFLRDDRFDANSWANNRSGARKGNFQQHIYGALGGPVVRNKVFFFANYQGTRVDRPGEGAATVAPEEWRRGDFSGLGQALVDPFTGQPFPGNVIPQDRFSPAARALLSDTTRYPVPNRPGLAGNYVSNRDSETRNHQGDLRLDANLSPNDNLSVRGSFGDYDNRTTQTAFPLVPGGGWQSEAQSVAANWSHVFGPTAVNELRVGFNHVTIDDNPASNDFGLGDYNQVLGIPGGQRVPGLSSIGFGNAGIDSVGNAAIRHFTNNKTFQVSEKLSLSRGRHYVSVGGQLLHYRMGQDYASNSGLLGSFNFNSQTFTTGHGFADFLLDLVGQKTIGQSRPWTQLQNRVGLFVQDDFKVSSSLTLNLGLRWEYASPITEKDDQQVNLDVDTGEKIEIGQRGLGRGLYEAYYGGFSPRAGFAWTLDGKTVVRGGYGMVQYQEGTGANNRLPINPPFFGEFTRSYVGSPGRISDGFADVADATNVQLRAWQLDFRPQLTQQWNLFFERQVTGTTSLSLGYVGSRSTRVVAFRDINQALPGVGDPSTWAPYQERRRLASAGITGPVRYTSSDARINYHGLQASLRRRRANGIEFLASYTYSRALTDQSGFYGPGWSGYNANTLNSGLGGDGSYNSYDLALDYGPAWFSAAHSASFSGSFDLPFGKGRKFGSDWSGATEALLGGWNVSAILSVRSGLPGTATAGWGPGSSLQNSGFSFERPDVVPGVDPIPSNADWDRWLDIGAFQPAALGSFGDSGIGVWRGPGFYNVDLGVDKSFELGGSRFLILRVEAFNVLNHPNKGMPVRDITNTAQFGQILGTANAARVLEFAAKFTFDD